MTEVDRAFDHCIVAAPHFHRHESESLSLIVFFTTQTSNAAQSIIKDECTRRLDGPSLTLSGLICALLQNAFKSFPPSPLFLTADLPVAHVYRTAH